MNILLFEDQRVDQLYPITIGRAAYAVTCGGSRLVDWVTSLGSPVRSIVRRHLVEIERLDFAQLSDSLIDAKEPTLWVNARVVPSVATYNTLRRLIKEQREGIVLAGDVVAAAIVPPSVAAPASDLSVETIDHYFSEIGVTRLNPLEAELPLLDYPHDVIRNHIEILADNLAHRIEQGVYREIADGVFAAGGATLGQFVISDTRAGPIVLDENATIGPYCFLSGPLWMGHNSRVIEHSAIKDGVSLGHTTKIGGEVEASIVEPYTNKQHHGFMGHSYLGSWINLGAGTCNSDLKNTYGEVRMDYRGVKTATGMQFVGCIIGDYAKTAINTGIFTGKLIGACSMVYGFVTRNVPSFVNYARSFGQVTEMPPEVMSATQQRMFLRRGVEQRSCDIELLHHMYELTRHERHLAGEPLTL